MIGQFSLCLTYSQVLHQPYTEAQLIFFFTCLTKINKHAGYAAISWPRFNNSPGRGTTIINSNVSDERSQN